MTDILTAAGKKRTRSQQRNILKRRTTELRTHLEMLRIIHDPSHCFARILSPRGPHLRDRIGKTENVEAAVRREALIDLPTALWLEKVAPMFAEVNRLTNETLPKPENGGFNVPSMSWVRVRANAGVAALDRDEPLWEIGAYQGA